MLSDAPTPRARVELLDNAKAVLICCVVLYHTAVVYTSADRPEVGGREIAVEPTTGEECF